MIDYVNLFLVKNMNDLSQMHMGRLRAHIESYGITNELDALICAIEQDDEHDLDADPDYASSALHSNREWIIKVLDAASKATDIDYKNWCDDRRKEKLEVLIKELEEMKK